MNNHRSLVDRRFTEAPVVIGGCGRSGTTLVLSVLSAHPSIYAIPYETWTLWPTVSDEEFDARIDELVSHIDLEEVEASKRRWCEKTPKNVHAFSQLLRCLGDGVRLINLVRDGRDVVTSVHPHDPSKKWVSVERWVEDVGAGDALRGHPQLLTVRYEDLVTSFEATIAAICAFVGEPASPEILDWLDHTTVRTHSAWAGTAAPIHSDSIGQWREPANEPWVGAFMRNKRAMQLLERYGYI